MRPLHPFLLILALLCSPAGPTSLLASALLLAQDPDRGTLPGLQEDIDVGSVAVRGKEPESRAAFSRIDQLIEAGPLSAVEKEEVTQRVFG